MITAIPMNRNQISNHFTKADCFIFMDENGTVISKNDNPALASTCADKSALEELLSSQKAQRVIVRNIGERMLGKLLENDMAIYQVNARNAEIKDLLNNSDKLKILTSAEQGQPSINYRKKEKDSGCGCHHNNADHEHSPQYSSKEGKCCNKTQNNSQHAQNNSGKPCCQS